MSSSPLVSVVLPTFNRAHTLPRAMASVLRQTYGNLELLVVDDCSTDDTERVVAAIAAQDPRVRFIRRERNGGASAARNTGIREARGELIAFQDSDDEWLLDKLRQQIEKLAGEDATCAMCVCSYLVHRSFDAHRSYFLGGANMTYPGDLQRQALVNFFFPTPSWLARTAVLRDLGGFDEALRCWEDWELAIRVSRKHGIVLLDEPLYIQHVSRGSVNRQDESYGPSLARILEKHDGAWTGEPRVLAEHLYVIGRHEVRYGSIAAARNSFQRAARLRPDFRRARTAWLATAFGGFIFRMAEAWRRWRHPEQVPDKSSVLAYLDDTHGPQLSRRRASTDS